MVEGLSSSSRLINSSIEDGAIAEHDRDGNLVGQIGKQHDGTHGAVKLAGPVPPVPSAPVAEGGPAALTIIWDGRYASEDDRAPLDLHVVEVYAAPEPFTDRADATLVGAFPDEAGGRITVSRPIGTWHVALVAKSEPGRRSPISELASAEVTSAMDPAVLDELDRQLAELETSLATLEDVDLPALRGTLIELETVALPEMRDRLEDAELLLGPMPARIEAAEQAADDAQQAADDAAGAASAAQTEAEAAAQAALDAAGIAEGKGQVITQVSAPSGARADSKNLWVRLPDHKVHIYDGERWVAATDPDLIAAAGEAAQALQDAADAAQAAQDAADAAQGAHDRAEALEGQVGTLQVDLDAAVGRINAVQNTTLPALSASLATLRDTTVPNLQATVGALPADIQAAHAAATAAAGAASTAQGAADAAASAASSAAGIAGSKADVLIQNTAPPAAMRKATTLWIDTTGGLNTPKRWTTGTTWVAVTDRVAVDAASAAAAAATAASTAQGRADDAHAKAVSLEGQVGTLQTDLGTAVGRIDTVQNTTLPALSTSLTTLRDTTVPNLAATVGALPADIAAAHTAATNAATAASTAQGAADAAASAASSAAGIAGSKADVLIQSTAPPAAMRKATTLWIDTTGGTNTPKRWTTGTTWVAVTDKVAVDAATAAANAATAASTAQGRADAAHAKAVTLEGQVGTLQTDLGTAVGRINTVQNTTLPALSSSLTTLRDTTVPNLAATVGALPATITAAQAAADAAQAEAESKADLTWVLSRGTDLVTNGTGYMGDNTNFKSYTFDPTDAPIGSSGSFYRGVGTALTTELIPVDPAKSYVLSVQIRNRGEEGTTARAYTGLVPHDVDGLQMQPPHYVYDPATMMELAEPLAQGDTQMVFTTPLNAADWTHTPLYYTVGVWNYQDGKGRVWPAGTFTRHTMKYDRIEGNILHLSAPYAFTPRPAGTPISRNFPGGTYMYLGAANHIIPREWTTFRSGIVTGTFDGRSKVTAGATTSFPVGTANVKMLLWNNSGVGGPDVGFANVSFSDATAAMAEAQAAQADANALKLRAATLEGQVGTLQTDLTAAQTAIATTLPGAIADAKAAGELAGRLLTTSTAAPVLADGANKPTGAIWVRNDANRNEIGRWRWSGSAWQTQAIGPVMIPDLAASKITTGQLGAARINVTELAASIANVIQLNASRITAGEIGAARINVTELSAAIANVIQLNASRITAGELGAARINVSELAVEIADVIELNAGKITTGQLGAARINVTELAASVANVIQLNASRITTGELGAARINVSELAVEIADIIELNADKITAGLIQGDQINATSIASAVAEFLDLHADQITSGTIKAGQIDVQGIAGAVAEFVEIAAEQITSGKIQAAQINTETLATALATILVLDAGRIQSGTISTARLNATQVAAHIANVIQLNASRITAGELGAARINVSELRAAMIAAKKITALEADLGTFTADDGFVAALRAATLVVGGPWSASDIASLPASKIGSGTIGLDRVPALPTDKVTGLPAKITTYDSTTNKVTAVTDASGNLLANKVTGALATTNIPNLPTSKITSGTLADARIPSLAQSKITGLPAKLTEHDATTSRVAGWTTPGQTTIDGGKIETNSIKADQIDVLSLAASEAFLLDLTAQDALIENLVLRGEAGGTTTEVSGRGLQVTGPGEQTAIQLGNFDELGLSLYKSEAQTDDDGQPILDDDGQPIYASVPTVTLNDSGEVGGRIVHANESLVYRGEEVSEWLDRLPRGVITRRTLHGNHFQSIPEQGGTLEMAELAFTMHPGRLYRVVASPISTLIGSGSSNRDVYMDINWTKDGTRPRPTSERISRDAYFTSSTNSTMFTFHPTRLARVLEEEGEVEARVLLLVRSLSRSVAIREVGDFWVEDVGIDAGSDGGVTINHLNPNAAPAPTPPPAPVPTRTYTKTYGYSWHRTWEADGTIANASQDAAYQGRTPYYTSAGIYRSMVGVKSMTSDLSGATIKRVRVRVRMDHSHNADGATVVIGTTSNASRPSTFSGTSTDIVRSKFSRGQEKWITLPSSTWAGFISGARRGVVFYINSTSTSYYAKMAPGRVAIEVTYEK